MIKKMIKLFSFLFEFVKYYFLYFIAIWIYGKKNIYIISERGIDARDNGYCLFKYIRSNYNNINCYYIINKDSPDFDKVKALGNVIIYRSLKHYLLFIAAKYKISTHLYGYSTNRAFYERCSKFIHFHGKKIFLQHGIIKDDIPMLYKENAKVDLFITSAKAEYEYVLQNYHYNTKIVKQTGLARFDNLYNFKTDNQILIMPTWRSDIADLSKKEFIKTNYYKRWNSLINNEKLCDILEKNNLKLFFYLHIQFQKFSDLFFSKSKNIIIAKFEEYEVQDLLLHSKVLITDYSSVFFDFAYMNKPIIYFQFDNNDFRKKHYYEGYFSYKDMGFGDIVNEENQMIESLQEIISRNYFLSDTYQERINNFFTIKDKENCRRILEEINKL